MLKNIDRTNKLFERMKKDIPRIVNIALREDLGGNLNLQSDITSLLLSKKQHVKAKIIANDSGIFCGKHWFEEVFLQLNELNNNKEDIIKIDWLVNDTDIISNKQILCYLSGSAPMLLTGERTALNFIQTLCGVATETKGYVDLLKGTDAILLDTRKTLPGLRTALKYAVLCGGGKNHRLDLSDAFLIKENHIIATGSISNAIEYASKLNINKKIEIEVENIKELQEAIEANADRILLDNFSYEDILQAVKLNNQRTKLEVSGNINLSNIRQYALTGIDYISVGAITKNVRAIDLSMRLI
ncbi:carboxylating nicotinate-nucleotide diphosphorylase [Candidatus Schneideria nysicola]|uniref:carboxylating nicotinate-nucleotide diphosphorylase n=1 Tax=Candidatus Schneideria nysicola TaxID=1081631 RepID=UPI001CAA4862|nr:carboxylating nicotinate-nucleotide diphosphorylase [Candidatus Schneideria nysicola]UAJ65117.1 carboxylating nicotinate-nucleotide diphosphorylase [Candidatus Schneideria nysicola]